MSQTSRADGVLGDGGGVIAVLLSHLGAGPPPGH
jgi:hypothetical protein